MTSYRFDGYVLSTERRLLVRYGQRIELTPKAFQLLEMLVRRRPSVVTKKEIQDRLWPETYVVEANIPNLVTEIRAGLCESARVPRRVRTVPGVGYAFEGLVVEDDLTLDTRDMTPVCSLAAEGQTVLIREGETLIGRDATCGLCLQTSTVSRRHALISVRGRTAVIEDLGSRNGTFIGGRRLVAPAKLTHGDVVKLGEVLLTFRMVSPQCATEKIPIVSLPVLPQPPRA
jgi:DNA-binding winged helix-turn-helix (wHTH) protein